MLFCRGVGRKVAAPLVVASILGWLLYVLAFAAFNHRDNYYNDYRQEGVNVNCSGQVQLRQDKSSPHLRASLDYFPQWCVLIVGPCLYICTFLHLIIGRFFSGVFTKFLTALYLVTGGAVIFFTAGRLFSDSRVGLKFQFCLDSVPNWLTNTYWGLWPLLEFVGVLVAILCMTLFMMMWPFFSPKYEEYYEEEEEYEEEEDKAV